MCHLLCFFKHLQIEIGTLDVGAGGRVAPGPMQSRRMIGDAAGGRVSMGSGWRVLWFIGGG